MTRKPARDRVIDDASRRRIPMRMPPPIVPLLIAFALAACGGADEAPPGNAAGQAGDAAVTPQATQTRLESLSEGQRNAVFIRAIQDSGEQCQHVQSSARAGDHQGLPLWRANCGGGVEYVIVIGNDGSAAVLNPAEAGLLESEAAATGNEAR
jgi:hypothetical protein